MGRVCSTHGTQARCVQGLGGRPLGRLRHGWEDNIKMDLQEVEWGGMDWIVVSQDRDEVWVLMKVVMNLQVPYNSGNFLAS